MFTVLVVDDNELDRTYLRSILEGDGYQVLEAESGREAIQLVERTSQRPIHLVLMDVVMPMLDGLDTVKRMRRAHPKHWFPIIYLSTKEDETLICQALEAGGDDFLTKPVPTNLLLAKMRAFARVADLQQELETMNLELFQSSITDPLTQVHNRLGFLNQFEVQWRICAREEMPMSVIMIDVDHFKSYNDTYGHPEGDRCLHAIAGALQTALKRPADLLGRFGGEEFIAMLPTTDMGGAVRIGEDMREAVRALNIASATNPKNEVVTVSVGVSTCEMVRLSQSENLIRTADDALYAAKGSGRNRVCYVSCNPHSLKHQEQLATPLKKI